MGRCIHHPDCRTDFKCAKHNVYLCRACLACKDPELYCKFRPSCVIAFMAKSGEKWDGAKK